MPPSLPELYISVDIETSGPIPGDYSMLSIGACLVDNVSESFYIELQPLNDNYTPEAMQTCNFTIEELKVRGIPPDEAMARFAGWVKEHTDGKMPVFVGFNAAFDWSFVNYYFIHYLGLDGNPFGHTALDIKAYYMGSYRTTWKGTGMKRLPPEVHSPDRPLAHNALEDAIQQAEIFERLFEAKPSNRT